MSGRTLKPRSRAGFTLVELIIASTLMTIVLAGVYTTFSIAMKTSRGGELNYQTYLDARRVLGIMTRELQGIPPEAMHLVSGDRESISLVTLASPMNVEHGESKRLLRVRYWVEQDEDDVLILVREEAPIEGPLPINMGEDAPVEALNIELGRPTEFDLATDVRDLSFHYQWAIARTMPRNEPPARAEIVGDGVVERRLPEGVRITLDLYDPGRGTGAPLSTFGEMVTFRTTASPVPAYLDPRNGAAK